ncbi:hypothetical protein GQ44DRAFT_729140 [Phaeosphaeriaceae sp. PMI808]|nr:hypothetical protein GQ44DRAFT_729140 [Phaeosphaeriaceae sp. PMI808]
MAQISSAAAGRELSLTQPLTLCPGSQYSFSVTSRQGNTLADCSLEFSTEALDDTKKRVLITEPHEAWLATNAIFTVGDDPSVDLVIRAKCNRYMGIVASDSEAWMRVEVQGVSVIRNA